jgi:hypothetical protein
MVREKLIIAKQLALGFIDTECGGYVLRIVIILLGLTAHYHPSLSHLTDRTLDIVRSYGPIFIAICLAEIFIPFFPYLLWMFVVLGFLTFNILDGLLFQWPRALIRRRFGILTGFIAAFTFQLGMMALGGWYLAPKFKTEGPIKVGAGVSRKRLAQIRRNYHLK